MYFLTKSVAKVIAVFYIVLYSVNQASCLKCYECTNLLGNEACLNNPQESRTCGDEVPNKENSALLSALTKFSATGTQDSDASESYKCYVLTGTHNGNKVIYRSCAPNSLSDEDIKAPAINIGVKVDDNLFRCDTELCNLSDPTSSTSASSSTTSTDPTSTLSPDPSSTPSPNSSSTPSPNSSSTPSSNSSSSLSVGYLILVISLLSILFD